MEYYRKDIVCEPVKAIINNICKESNNDELVGFNSEQTY